MAKHAVVISLDAMGSADLKARLQFCQTYQQWSLEEHGCVT